jgi:peptidoglycan/xylan/chitin deacetylase (PgdA/CDA1 family)
MPRTGEGADIARRAAGHPAWHIATAMRGMVGPLLGVLLMLSTAPSVIAGEAARVSSGARSSGAVALTFDDGYDRRACARIAQALRAHGARGTFFLNGVNLRRDPGAWRRILRGQAIGNHSWSHPDLTRAADAAVRAQILHNEAVQERILGRPMLKLLRPPYGAEDPRVRRIAGELGYRRTVLWSVDTGDWRSSATVRSIVDRAIGAPAGSIILMHCGPAETPLALPAIIRHYQSRGLALTGLGAVLAP